MNNKLVSLIRATGMKTFGEAMVAIREWRFARRLTGPEANHLLTLLENAREEGSYYGPRQQYYARTERLIQWCSKQIKRGV